MTRMEFGRSASSKTDAGMLRPAHEFRFAEFAADHPSDLPEVRRLASSPIPVARSRPESRLDQHRVNNLRSKRTMSSLLRTNSRLPGQTR